MVAMPRSRVCGRSPTSGSTHATSTLIATRGERLVLTRDRYSGRDEQPEAFRVEMLSIVEIDADERIAAVVAFDLDDFDAAFAELDARYLAGEAAAHARTWSVIVQRLTPRSTGSELPAMTPDWVSIDHRRVAAFAPGELTDIPPRRHGISRQTLSTLHRGCASAERPRGGRHPCGAWDLARGLRRRVAGGRLFTVEGDLVNRCEVFDEADLDAALARFEELSRPAPRLENAASQVAERIPGALRRPRLGRHGGDAGRRLLQRRSPSGRERRSPTRSRCRDRKTRGRVADLGATNMTSTVIATRGERLALMRARYSGRDQRPEAFHVEVLDIVRDRRRRADRGGGHVRPRRHRRRLRRTRRPVPRRRSGRPRAARGRSIARAYAAFNRRRAPRDDTGLGRRSTIGRSAAFAPGDAERIHPRRVGARARPQHLHRGRASAERPRSGRHPCGAVGPRDEGFDAEWRMIDLFTVEGDLINRCEIFDEADLDAALARFERTAAGRHHGWKTRQAEWTSAFRRTSRPATGTRWPRCWPTTFPSTIGVGW